MICAQIVLTLCRENFPRGGAWHIKLRKKLDSLDTLWETVREFGLPDFFLYLAQKETD